MEVNEFLEKYYLHDSAIDEISYDSGAKELIWHMDFAFWMQSDYVEGTPEMRTDNPTVLESAANAKTAVLFTVAYLYEHREEADHHALTLTLHSLLFGSRKEEF